MEFIWYEEIYDDETGTWTPEVASKLSWALCEEVYDDETDTWIPEAPEEGTFGPALVLQEEVYDDKSDTWVPEAPEEGALEPILILQEEGYDDETGTWIPEAPEEELVELDLPWEQELDLTTLLNERDRSFSKTEAFTLCAALILDNGSPQELNALLDLCPPLEKFLEASRVDYPIPEFWGYLGLVELAAYLGRTELLDVLLRRGGNVNCRPSPDSFPISPLEAAAWGGDLDCVKRLLDEPGIDLTFSVHLQRLWAKPEPEKGQRQCLGYLLPLVAGVGLPDRGPLPIPEQFFPAVAIEMGNEELFLRLCHERSPFSHEEAEKSLGMLWAEVSLMGRMSPPDMLLALLDIFPAALEHKEGQALLALSGVDFPQDTRLDPWLIKLQSKSLPLSLLAQHFAGWEKDGVQTRCLKERMGIS